MTNDELLRQELTHLLTKRQAHLNFEDAVANFPEAHINTVPPGCNYSFWQVLEHLRICQKDILDYIESDSYRWLKFPDDLWPETSLKADGALWQKTINDFLADRQKLAAIINDPGTDLFAVLPNSGKHKHTILREINVIGSHNAYHTGGLVIMRQSISIWHGSGLDLDELFSESS